MHIDQFPVSEIRVEPLVRGLAGRISAGLTRLGVICSALPVFTWLVFSPGVEAQNISVLADTMTLSNYQIPSNTAGIQLKSIYSPGTATTSFSGSI